jgi:hypothetical protein
MEYWSIEKNNIDTLSITPTLQYSNTPKSSNKLKLKVPIKISFLRLMPVNLARQSIFKVLHGTT